MNVIETKIPGVLIIEPKLMEDNRGYFVETYNEERYREFGIPSKFIQDNMSFTLSKGTLRGLHFQNNPKAQAKLVSCSKGRVIDVVVDIRKGSPTYLEWLSVELSEENHRQLYIPRGFAHGFLTLSDNVEFRYKVDNYYSAQHDRGIRYDDPDINVDWGSLLEGNEPILSEKDKNGPTLSMSDCNFIYEEDK